MEEIRRVARAAYENLRDEEKRKLEGVFRSLDKNGDGKISLHEFTDHSDQHTQSFFSLLDQNGDGFLQFDEILALSYITASGRPFCAACKHFIPGMFFTCTQCRLSNTTQATTYDLCIPCYQGRRFRHQHNEFDDNYMLLLKLQRMRLSGPTPSPQFNQWGSPQNGPSYPGRRRRRLKEKMKKSFGTIGTVVFGAAAVANLAQSWSSIFRGDGGGDEEDDGDAAVNADDPTQDL